VGEPTPAETTCRTPCIGTSTTSWLASLCAHERRVVQHAPPRPYPRAVVGHRGHYPLLDMHLHMARFRMCAEAPRRERTEKRPSQVGALGRDIDCSGEIAETEADLATLPGFQCFLGAFSLRRRKDKPSAQLGTYRRSEERIGVASTRQCIIKAKASSYRPMHP